MWRKINLTNLFFRLERTQGIYVVRSGKGANLKGIFRCYERTQGIFARGRGQFNLKGIFRLWERNFFTMSF